jgi:hypothetical protein
MSAASNFSQAVGDDLSLVVARDIASICSLSRTGHKACRVAAASRPRRSRNLFRRSADDHVVLVVAVEDKPAGCTERDWKCLNLPWLVRRPARSGERSNKRVRWRRRYQVSQRAHETTASAAPRSGRVSPRSLGAEPLRRIWGERKSKELCDWPQQSGGI